MLVERSAAATDAGTPGAPPFPPAEVGEAPLSWPAPPDPPVYSEAFASRRDAQ